LVRVFACLPSDMVVSSLMMSRQPGHQL
jgi:hypothetical protein